MLKIRSATVTDAPTIATITMEGWNEAYKGLIAQETLDSMSLEKRTEGWKKVLTEGKSHVIVAEVEGKVIGFSSFGRSRYEQHGLGEIYAFYVQKAYQRQGIGRLLVEKSLESLSTSHIMPAIVLTLSGNTPAQRFYEELGFKACGTALNEIDGKKYEEVVYLLSS